MVEILLSNIGLTRILEFVAAIVVTFSFFLFKESRTKAFNFLLLFLWLTVLIEFIGSYTRLVVPYCFEDISFFKEHSQFLKNYWIFNIYLALAYTFYTWFFYKQLISTKNKTIIKCAIAIFNIITIIDFLNGDIFFIGYSQLMNLFGLILIVLVLSMYYHELLSSDRILSINNSLPFYISIGVLLFFITVTPLYLSSQYIKAEEIVFTKYYRLILSYANYFLYGIIIFGVVRCYWFNKSQNTKFSLSPTLS